MKQKTANKKPYKRVQVSFSPTTFKLISDKANSIGLPVAEYLRYSGIHQDLSNYVEILDEKTEKELAEALEDVKMGRVTKGMTVKEAIEFLRKDDENN